MDHEVKKAKMLSWLGLILMNLGVPIELDGTLSDCIWVFEFWKWIGTVTVVVVRGLGVTAETLKISKID